MIINEKGAFDIRQAVGGDKEYILQSWMYAYENSPEMSMPGMSRDDYFAYTHRLLDEIIARCSRAGSCYVCHQPNAPHLIRGYLCAEALDAFPVVYWVNVKKQEKKKGVASALMEQFYRDFEITPGKLVYTFSSKDLRGKWDKKESRFNDDLPRKAKERYGIVYHPWWKYTSQAQGWEV